MEKETKKTAEKTSKTPRRRTSRKTADKDTVQEQELTVQETAPSDMMEVTLSEEPVQSDTAETEAEVYTQPQVSEDTGLMEEMTPEQIESQQKELQQEIEQEKNEEYIASLIQNQRDFFATGRTKDASWRIEQLKKLYALIKNNQEKICQAIYADLNKSAFESYATEIGLVLKDISYHIHNLKKWSRPKRIRRDIHLLTAKLHVIPEPYGVTLIMGTWNYPFLLAIQPLVASISAGNTVVLKTSEYSTATNELIDALISKNFNSEYITVVRGGYLQNHALLNQHFDFIFFTGSQNVGKIVMSNAARFLTPVCLELGGKNPCIIDDTANIAIAARRIAWGKFLNAGQTCVAPDYILIDKKIKAPFIAALKDEIKQQFGEKPLENKLYPKIINERHFVHLSTLCPYAEMDFISNKIAPTVIDLCDISSPDLATSSMMQEEIFGPLLPVITFQKMQDALAFVNSRPTPLAMYLFSTDKVIQKEVMGSTRYGGGCINDVVCHTSATRLPFGGFGESGMGSYHGMYGFQTFSHYKGILNQHPDIDMRYRYPPHANLGLMKFFFR